MVANVCRRLLKADAVHEKVVDDVFQRFLRIVRGMSAGPRPVLVQHLVVLTHAIKGFKLDTFGSSWSGSILVCFDASGGELTRKMQNGAY